MKEYVLTMAAVAGDVPRRVIVETVGGRIVAMFVLNAHATDDEAEAAVRRLRAGKRARIDLFRIRVEDGAAPVVEGRVKWTWSWPWPRWLRRR